MNKTITVPIAALIIIIFAGLGFYGGQLYQKKQSAASGLATVRGGFPMGSQRAGQVRTGGANRGGVVSGDILKQDATSIIISVQGGGSKIIYLSASSSVGKFVDGQASDLKIGQRVMVNGTPNADGSLVAQMIQIRPESQADNRADTQRAGRIGGPSSMPATSGPIIDNSGGAAVQAGR